MSVRATTWAWEAGRDHGLRQGELLVLVKAADHADQDGVCWPGEKGLAEYTVQGERTVRRHLASLEDRGLLHRERSVRKKGRGRRVDTILLHLDQPANLASKSEHDQPANGDRPTGQILHDQPANGDRALYREPSVEPSRETESDPVAHLFELWRTETGRDQRVRLTPGRRQKIAARLKEGYPVETIAEAIRRVARSPWHQGKHPRNDRRCDDLTLVCRSGEKLEELAELRVPNLRAIEGGGEVDPYDAKMRTPAVRA